MISIIVEIIKTLVSNLVSSLVTGIYDRYRSRKARKTALSEGIKHSVSAVYRTVLERDPDAEGLLIYGQQLQKKERTLRSVVREIGQSEEYFEKFVNAVPPQEAVRLFYRHFLCREPENEAIINEHIYLLNTRGWKSIVDKLVSSKEYLAKFGEHSAPYVAYKS